MSKEEHEEINEARKLIGSYGSGEKVSKVYKLSGEHNEGDDYHVKLFKNGKHHEPADYFTGDEKDAHGTAKHMVKESTSHNDEEINELSLNTLKSYYKKAKAERESLKGEKGKSMSWKERSNVRSKRLGGMEFATRSAGKKVLNSEEYDALSEEEQSSYELDESVASETLKAGSRPDASNPKSKLEAINSVIGSMNAMSSDELTKWFTNAMALVGKETSKLPGSANTNANKNTLNMKGSAAVSSGGATTGDSMPKLNHMNNPLASMKEDVEEMFVGTDLSEEFRDKATTLFEAAVNARAQVEIARLEEQYEEALEEEISSIIENVENTLDTYLDYVAEKWLQDNQVAIESSLRNEITEEFIDGLKGLFSEHYIDVPEEKVDVIESMARKIETLESALNESINDNVDLKTALTETKKLSLIDELSEGLTMSQAEKFAALAEGVGFDGNFDSYIAKLEIVKETYFSTRPQTSNIEEETFEGDVENANSVSMDPHVSNYVRAIARTTKK